MLRRKDGAVLRISSESDAVIQEIRRFCYWHADFGYTSANRAKYGG